MGKNKDCQIERLNSDLEQAYIQAEYEDLLDYFIAIGRGESVEDPRPGMSFLTPEMEMKAQKHASCVVNFIEEFDGEIEEGGKP